MRLERFLQDELSLGKGAIKMPIKDYLDKQRASYKEYRTDIKSRVFKLKERDGWVIHVEIPSGSLDNFYYDVLIELSSAGDTLEDSHVKIFSNSPSFIYSFAYVFYHMDDDELESKGLIMDEFHQKIPKNNLLTASDKVGEQPLTHPAVIRNPYGIPLFDKTVYLAVFHILEKYKRKKFPSYVQISNKDLLKRIDSFDALMQKRHIAENKAKQKEIAERLENAPKKLRKEALDQLKQGNNVYITSNNVVKMSESKNVKKVQAITGKKSSSSIHKVKPVRGR